MYVRMYVCLYDEDAAAADDDDADVDGDAW